MSDHTPMNASEVTCLELSRRCAATFAEKGPIVLQSCTVDRAAAWSACDPIVRGALLGLRGRLVEVDRATRSAPAIISGEFGGQFAVVARSRVPNQGQQRLML
jgi:hypothetical protein